MKKYLAVGGNKFDEFDLFSINEIKVKKESHHYFEYKNGTFKLDLLKKVHKKSHFHQLCDTREEAKEALLSYIKRQIENKDTQIEKLNCERSELSKHAARIEGE